MINNIKHIHFIGIKGVAMAALAILSKRAGIKVSGSDIEEEFVTDKVLKRFGISWKNSFSENNLEGNPDLVIVTGAHGGMTNPEAIAAQKKGLNVLMHGKALGKIMDGYFQISVAGCHGKTTTSAITAYLFSMSGLSPSFAIGCADIPSLKTPGLLGKGKYFIAEADEYMTCPETDKTPRFLWQKPSILVITNIEYDHPDAFKNINEVKKAFLKLISRMPNNGTIICCVDNENVISLLKSVDKKVITYGFSSKSDWIVSNVRFNNGKTRFNLNYKGQNKGNIEISIPGEHNSLNATASLIVALEVGLKLEDIKKYFPLFSGTKRRFEFITEKKGIKLYDDYAHHPTEITASLKAARKIFPNNRIICIFQPHTFSRTRSLFNEFATSFKDADIIIITGIYSSSREEHNKNISGKILANEIIKTNPSTVYIEGEKEIGNYLKNNSLSGDIIFTMGAGDIFRWHKTIIDSISKKEY